MKHVVWVKLVDRDRSGSLCSAAAGSTRVGSCAMNTRVTLRVDFNLSSSAEDSVPGALWARGRGAQLVGRAALTPLAPSRAGLLGGLLPSNVVYGTGQELMVDATSAPTPELPLRVAGDGRRLSSLWEPQPALEEVGAGTRASHRAHPVPPATALAPFQRGPDHLPFSPGRHPGQLPQAGRRLRLRGGQQQ